MYTEKDLVRVAKRKNNKKRNYLVINQLQGKHIPVKGKTALKTYEEQDINLHYLVKTQHDKYSAMADLYKQEGTYHVMKNAEDIPEYNEWLLNHYQNARRLVNAGEYEKACDSLWTQLIEKEKGSLDYESILVYENLKDVDLSYEFIEAIEEQFEMENEIVEEVMEGKGIDEIKKIVHTFNISDINFVKPGIGETTRVLLRRVPWKVLIDEKYKDDIALRHIIRLAEEKNVPVEYYPLVHYKCCGIIKKMADV